MIESPYKLGLDIHGVLTTNPKLFIGMAKQALSKGGEVHIVTGSPKDQGVDKLLSLSDGYTFWTHYFSIQDYLAEDPDCDQVLDKNGYPHFDPWHWNRVKAIYCAQKDMDLHVDDQMIYLEHFTTPYMLYNGDPERIRKYYVPLFKG